MDDAPQRSSFSLLRRWGAALHSLFSVLLLLAIVGMVNYVASRRYARIDLTAQDRPPLSPLTRQLLAGLTNDVRLTVLYDPEASALFGEVKALLGEYQAGSRRLQLEFVNYARNKGRAEFLMGQYRITSSSDPLLVVFDTPGRSPLIVREKELSEFDMSGAFQGGPVRRVGFKGEQFFSAALLSLADRRPLRAAFLTGHGEPDLAQEDAPDGFRQFATLLAEKNVVLTPTSLRTQGVPEDCQLLVIAGPRHPIPADELQAIDRYLASGGRALILLHSPARPGVRPSGLERALLPWNVEVGDNVVVDRAQSQAGDTRVLLTDQMGAHAITEPLRGSRVALVMPRSVRPRGEPGRAGDAARAHPLLLTSPQGTALTQVRGGQALVETNGVISLAVAVEKGALAGVSSDRGTTRLVIVGEAAFLGNSLLEIEANRDFAALAVNWLLDRRQLMGISPRPIREYRIQLSRTQMHAAAWLLLGVLPGSALVLGLAVWLRRRK